MSLQLKLVPDPNAGSRADEQRRWVAWLCRAEQLTGHRIDGQVWKDGLSIDQARDAFKAGISPDQYVANLLANTIYRRARYRDERRLINAAGYQ